MTTYVVFSQNSYGGGISLVGSVDAKNKSKAREKVEESKNIELSTVGKLKHSEYMIIAANNIHGFEAMRR